MKILFKKLTSFLFILFLTTILLPVKSFGVPYAPIQTVRLESYHNDSFGKIRVTNPTTLAEYDHLIGKDPRHWDESITGTATSTYVSNTVSVDIATGLLSGDKVIRQTYRYHQYFKGKSQLIELTGNFHGHETNIRKRYGAFDANNGVFFESDGSTFYAVVRSSVTGSVVDTKIAQSSWNIDKFDGTGPSGITIDISKQNLFVISYSWLGSGGVRFGFQVNGRIYYAHFYHAGNNLNYPWARSGSFPIRAEIENLAITTGGHMHITCSTIMSEGGQTNVGAVYSLDTGIVPVAVTTTPIIVAGIRINPSYIYSSIRPLTFSIKPEAGNTTVYWKVLYRPTIVTPVWTPYAGNADALTSYVSYSGGYQIASGYVDLATKSPLSIPIIIEDDVFLGFDIAENPEALVLVARTVTSTGTILFTGSFREYK